MSEFEISGFGTYRTRAGGLIDVTSRKASPTYPWRGRVGDNPACWTENGQYNVDFDEHDLDIVAFVAFNSSTTACALNEQNSHDPVNHPKHYTGHPSGVECITVTEHMNFCRGNAVKYIWRAGDKGNEVQDLEKAVWYLQREIARLKNQA